MADEVDISNERSETILQSLIVNSKQPPGPVPNGRCHYCDEIVEDEARWCNAVCRDEWSKELARGRR